MAKKKIETEEKAEPKVKQKQDKMEIADVKENLNVKSSPAKKETATKKGKPDSPAIAEIKESKSKTKEAKQEIAEDAVVANKSIEVVEAQEEIIEAPKSEPKVAEKKSEPVITPMFNPNVRYSDEELQEFATLITQEKETALDELRMLKERLDDLTSFDAADESMIYSMHMAEQGSEAQEKEKTYAQIQRIHEYIKKLEESMERVKNKTYGICRVCGCLIAKARLRAVPITTLSASYKIHQKCPEDGVDRIEPVKK